jgi:glutamate/tyrosine decarboxylase-like PLP-dependent enzyme
MSDSDAPRLFSGATPEKVAAELAPLVDFREEGLPMEELKVMIKERLLPHLMRYDLPSFQGLFNARLEDGAAYGAHLALSWNQGVTNWQVSPGGSTLEELCCQALCRLFGLAPEADATILYCGTYANQQALYMALSHRANREGFDFAQKGLAGFADPSRLRVAVSADAHFSLNHGVRFLGLGEDSLIPIGVDENRRMDVDRLRSTLEEVEDTRDVFCVVATAGTTSTGSVDPIDEIADVCQEHGAWLHVDGAYGLAYGLVPEKAPLFNGLERADTVAWDPHKQMAVPIPNSILFARDRELFRPMALFSHYWNRADAPGPNPGLKSIPSTRPFSALPLVTSIRHQGLSGVVDRLRKPLSAIQGLYEAIQGQPDLEPLHEPDTGILCFRVVPEGVPEEELDRLQEFIYQRTLAEGKRIISVSQVGGRASLRAVAIIPEVTVDALLETVAEARRMAKDFS